MDKYTVIFQPAGLRGRIEEGKTVLEASQELGVEINSICGGNGVCGKCKIRLEEGNFSKYQIISKISHLSPVTEIEENHLNEEEILNRYRLACQAKVKGDVLICVPTESRKSQQIILEGGKDRQFILDPAVKKYYVELNAATLEDNRDDFQRLKDALSERYDNLNNLTIDFPVLRDLPGTLREKNWKVTVTIWKDKEIIRIESGLQEHVYGAAFDVGTTTVAVYLCNLNWGEVIAVDSIMNPQISYGEDIISRINYCIKEKNGRKKMFESLLTEINNLLEKMCKEQGISLLDIYEVVFVGNTVIHHLMLNIDPQFIGGSPFIPAISDPMDIKARDMGLRINPCGNVHILPLIAGYVGADNVAVLLAEEPYKDEEIRLLIDVGTNGEVNLGNKKMVLCTSCATGPAFEGAQITFGMRAAPGAIERVRIDPKTLEVRYKTIGAEKWYPQIKNTQAKGICGSGIIEAIAEMCYAGILHSSGRFNLKLESPRIRRGDKERPEFVLAWSEETLINRDIVITQTDVRAIQLAKAALYSGAKIMMEKTGIERFFRVTLAGAFGNFIDPQRAMSIGMFPSCSRVEAVGNAAGDGAKIALFNQNKREEAGEIARRAKFIETAAEPRFQDYFTEALELTSFPGC